MWRITRSQTQPLGVDIGRDSLKLLQLEVIGESLCVRCAARAAYPAEVQGHPELRLPVAVDLLRQMLREHPFSGHRAVAALPKEIVHIKSLRLPLMPATELEQAVQFEARQLFSFDLDDARMHFLPAGEVRQGNDVLQEVIVLAAANEDVNQFVEQIHRTGLVIDSLDTEQCALFRTVERFIRRREDEQELHALVDVGYGGSQVVIGKGRDISFLKLIEIGGRHIHEAVSRKLGIPMEEAQSLRRRLADSPEPAEGEKPDPVRQAVVDATRSVIDDLAREVSLCLRYHSVTFRGHRPSKLRLVGGESCDKRLQATLAAALSLPVDAGRALASVDTSRMKPLDRCGALGQWAVALGLGLRRTEGRFAQRDGRPRDTALPIEPSAALQEHLAATAAAPAVPLKEEAAHA